MREYIFILGRSFELCCAEIISYLKFIGVSYEVLSCDGRVFYIKSEVEIDLERLNSILAGVYKAGEVVGKFKNGAEIEKKLFEILKKSEGRVEFGLSFYNIGGIDRKRLALNVKRELKEEGLSVRVVFGGSEVSSVPFRSGVRDFIVYRDEDDLVLVEISCVQDFESWSSRDYDRPEARIKKGMLPPKVGRMMVNLGMFEKGEVELLCDPFCGVGTVLSEALMVGLRVIGVDNDGDQVERAEKNLEWFCEAEKKKMSFKVLRGDAVKLSGVLKEKVDLIVTEPYLGPVELGERKVSYDKAAEIARELDDFFIDCLCDWREVLKKDGVVVIALPSYRYGGKNRQEIVVKRVIDNREKLGYNLIGEKVSYSREQAVVVRNIYILKKK